MADFKENFLQKCLSCGFVFCGPVPTQEELVEHYKGYTRNDDISPITIKRYHKLLDGFEKYRKHNRIIDVGCGNGHFLKVALSRGWEVYGTEFTDEAILECTRKNINMKKGALNQDDYEAGFFDIITSFEVLEHINNPLEEIKKFKSILRTGGLIYLTTPNFNSLSRYYLRQKWTVIEYPEHLSYYTAKTLRLLFEKSGFQMKKIEATGISVGRINEAKETALKEDSTPHTFRTDDELIRKKIEDNSLLKFAVYSANTILSTFKVGDSLKGYFIKNESKKGSE